MSTAYHNVSDNHVPVREKIVNTALFILQEDGFDGLKVRDVATHAHVSLATLYKLYPTRDELIAAAVGCWMNDNVFPRFQLSEPPNCLSELLNNILIALHTPFETDPWMADVCHKAFTSKSGHKLQAQYFNILLPVAKPYFDDLDPTYMEDINLILSQLFTSLMIDITNGVRTPQEALHLLQRAVVRLTQDNKSLAQLTKG